MSREMLDSLGGAVSSRSDGELSQLSIVTSVPIGVYG
jgi:hypothetical protein